MQVAGLGSNLWGMRKSAIEGSIELFYMILLWDGNLQKFTIWLAETWSSKAYFTENPYEGSYAGPYEGSNAGSNGMPNDGLKENLWYYGTNG